MKEKMKQGGVGCDFRYRGGRKLSEVVALEQTPGLSEPGV